MLSKPLVLIRARPSTNGATLKGQRLEVIAIAPNEAWSANAGNWQLAYKALVVSDGKGLFVDVEEVTDLLDSGEYLLHVPLLTRVVRYVSRLCTFGALSKLF